MEKNNQSRKIINEPRSGKALVSIVVSAYQILKMYLWLYYFIILERVSRIFRDKEKQPSMSIRLS
jgi:hypothetical protein